MSKQHSILVGGSTAGRLLNCPASLAAIRALPPSADRPSEYAEEGSAMHAVMDHLMRWRMRIRMGGVEALAPADWIGRVFHDRPLTQEHLDTMVLPALEQLAQLEEDHAEADPFEVVGVEQRVTFPGVPGAFGTIDLILRNSRFIILADWKFGQGVGVRAEYPDGAGVIVNPQLMYYASAALRTKPRLFAGRRIIVAIIQPRGAMPLSHTEVTRKELRTFVEDMHNAVLAAVDRSPPMKKGEHCRWAPCKVACPLWTGPLLDLSLLQPAERTTSSPAVTPYAQYLAHAKYLLDTAVQLKGEVDAQMHAYLENGGVIPGWKLKDKATRRVWVNPDLVEDTLGQLGFDEDEIWRRELVPFKQAEAVAKRLGVKIPDELRVAPPPSGTTLATSDDPAPPVSRVALIDKFTASLRLLQNQAVE
jgi:hypothetical protein